MRIIIGSDHYGFPLKEDLKQYLIELGHEPVDVGAQNADVPVDYPDVAAELVAPAEFADVEDAYLDLADMVGESGELWKQHRFQQAACFFGKTKHSNQQNNEDKHHG